MEPVVSVDNVSKKYCRNIKRSVVYAVSDIVRATMGIRTQRTRLRPKEFWALEDVSFQLQKGRCLGLIGANGAGKSSLLKMLNGILRPDTGCIRIKGRVGALIEIGAGFHPLLTGRENIYLNGAILGLRRKEIDRKLEAIVDFSGLEASLLDAPVKTYSSGMYVRLGFAVAAHCEPDILLVDEALSVGDIAFVGRCRTFLADLVQNGTSVILVTHRLHEVDTLCHDAILLEQGRIIEYDNARSVVDTYRRKYADGVGDAIARTEPGAATNPIGAQLRLTHMKLTNSHHEHTDIMHSGETCHLDLELRGAPDSPDGELRIWLWREEGDVVTAAAAVPLETLARAQDPFNLRFRFPLLAMPGHYRVGAQVSGPGRFDYVDCHYTHGFEIVADRTYSAFVPKYAYAHSLLDIHPEQPIAAAATIESFTGRYE